MFTLVELESFVAVAEEGGFRKAARRMQMTQPPLSRQILRLERALGVTLFERVHAGVRLTAAGRAFLVEAKAILGRAAGAEQVARRASEGTVGTLGIGFTAVSALTVLGDWLQRCGEGLPDVRLQLEELVTRDQIDRILAGDLDVGLARGVMSTDVLDTCPVHRESLVLAVPNGHRLSRLGRSPTMAEIAREPLVSYSPTTSRYFYDRVAECFMAADLMPRYVQLVTQVTTALVIVASGLAVALVPESASRLRVADVRAVEVSEIPAHTIRTSAVWRKDSDNPVLGRFLTLTGVAAPPA